jgi:MFS family permease
MLASIHPLGERARRNRWSLTVSAYLAGSALGGLLAGAVAAGAGGALGAGLGPSRSSPGLATVAVAAGVGAAAAAAAWDLAVRRALPPRRQVNEDWLGRYRGWVYGAGFGVQLGAGLTTIVTTATVPLTFLLAFLAGLLGTPVAGGAAGLLFGLTRATPALLLRRVGDPAGLRRFHERMQSAHGRARLAAAGASAAVGCATLLATVFR